MTTGIQVGGTDIDSLFEPYHTGTKAANTGYQVGGVDIANRYQAVAAGNGTAYGTTGYQAGGTDIGTLFVKLGTYSTAPTVSISGPNSNVYPNTNTTSGLSAPLVATASGGNGTYSYSWTYVRNGGNGSLTFSAPTGASTNVSISGQSTNSIADFTVTCTVTSGGTASATYAISFTRGTPP